MIARFIILKCVRPSGGLSAGPSIRPCITFFSRDEATLYERVSVRWSVRPLVCRSVTLSFFGLLGATNAVYTAPLLVFFLDGSSHLYKRVGPSVGPSVGNAFFLIPKMRN